VNLSEQLEAAKRQAEVRKLDASDERVATELAKRIQPLPVNELSADIRTRLDPFNRWAIRYSARRCPAKPTTVALFALEQADLGVPAQQILAQLDAIEKLHDKWSLSNPVRTAIVRAALETIIKVDPPRSWPREDKVRFAQLDPDIRQIIETRERQRDVALRKLQNRQANCAETKPVIKPNEETKPCLSDAEMTA
jgi:hypothetical protein